mgnify:CR=1 FL=1
MAQDIAIILTNSQRRIIWVNDGFTKITGYTLTEAMGRSPGRLLQGPGTERETVERIRKNLATQAPFKDEIINYRKNGEEYVCRLVIHPIFNERQELTNFIAFEVDGDEIPDETDLSLLNLENKYSSSSLKGAKEMKLYQRLRRFMEEEKPYLDPDLTLRSVADRLASNTKYLSQVVNHYAGDNFQYFLNTYRVEEVLKKICDERFRHLTLFGIALQCGFKNKSTFYKVFREVTGVTPLTYLRSCQTGQN